jgi:hypothetical protein
VRPDDPHLQDNIELLALLLRYDRRGDPQQAEAAWRAGLAQLIERVRARRAGALTAP